MTIHQTVMLERIAQFENGLSRHAHGRWNRRFTEMTLHSHSTNGSGTAGFGILFRCDHFKNVNDYGHESATAHYAGEDPVQQRAFLDFALWWARGVYILANGMRTTACVRGPDPARRTVPFLLSGPATASGDRLDRRHDHAVRRFPATWSASRRAHVASKSRRNCVTMDE
jgi:hypothetical protein